jgi:hypothetical protein
MHDYVGERWAGLGPWHWYWEWEHQHRTPTAHAPTLEAAMADFRKVWQGEGSTSLAGPAIRQHDLLVPFERSTISIMSARF